MYGKRQISTTRKAFKFDLKVVFEVSGVRCVPIVPIHLKLDRVPKGTLATQWIGGRVLSNVHNEVHSNFGLSGSP